MTGLEMVRRRRGSRLKWWLLELLAAPRERAIRKQLLDDYLRATGRKR